MNRQVIILVSIFLLILSAVVGGGIYFSNYLFKKSDSVAISGGPGAGKAAAPTVSKNGGSEDVSPLQKEIEAQTKQTLTDMRAEQRLNLNMGAQLRTYNTMLTQLQDYGKKVEGDINLIKEISKNDFQENVALQANLFTGKKPELVAKHLEEFDPIRVGAILAKMKEKEASQVLDVWAVAPPVKPNGSTFYRDVFSAYLANRRHDMHPQLFQSIGAEEKPPETTQVVPIAPQQPLLPGK